MEFIFFTLRLNKVIRFSEVRVLSKSIKLQKGLSVLEDKQHDLFMCLLVITLLWKVNNLRHKDDIEQAYSETLLLTRLIYLKLLCIFPLKVKFKKYLLS